MPLAPGAPFPALTLPDPQGRPRALAAAWAGGEALLLLGHSDCRTTRQALPYLERIHRGSAPGRVLAVLQDDGAAAAGLAAELELSVPLACEPEPFPLARAVRLVVVPTFFLVGPDGRIVALSEALRRADLESFAARLGAGPVFEPGDPLPALRPG